jgi:hypothetical protein
MLVASGPVNILMLFLMQESNHPTILENKTRRLRKELGREDLHSHLEMRMPPRQVLARSLVRPAKVMSCSMLLLQHSDSAISFCSDLLLRS